MPAITLPQFVVQPTEGVAPGIVVIHEGTGISMSLLRFAQRLAAEGYTVACPDLYFRVGGTEAADIDKLMGSLDGMQVEADLVGTAAMLRAQGAPSVGVAGFCLGGSLSYRAAVDTGAFDAAFGFYGITALTMTGEPRCPVRMVYGDLDPYVAKEDLQPFIARHPDTVVYPGAGHGFMRDGTAAYHEAAASDAWQRLTAFSGST